MKYTCLQEVTVPNFLLPSHYFSLVKKLFGGQQIDLANIIVGLIVTNNQSASVCNIESLIRYF